MLDNFYIKKKKEKKKTDCFHFVFNHTQHKDQNNFVLFFVVVVFESLNVAIFMLASTNCISTHFIVHDCI